MKAFNNFFNRGIGFGLFLATGISQVLAQPRITQNPGGKTLDQVGDNALGWFFSDIRPWIIVLLIIAAVFGGWLGGRFRWAIAGTCTGLIIFLMALPSIIAKIYSWM